MTAAEARVLAEAEKKLAARRLPRLRRAVSRTSRAAPASRRQSAASGGWIGRSAWLEDPDSFLGDFYSYMRHRVPLINNAIGAWVDLSTSGATVQMDGGSERQQRKAEALLKDLDYRVYEYSFEWGRGLARLMEMFFLGIYTDGRFCAEAVPFGDGGGIAYVALVDPFTIKMKRVEGGVKLFQKVGDREVELPQERIFYGALEPDRGCPYGTSLLNSVGWVTEVMERMLDDMAQSSHNAGYPRMRVSVSPPEALPGEAPADFLSRANQEFDDTVDAFRDLDVDDNVFTWSNVQIDTVGGGLKGSDFSWSVNMERVTEEVVAGLHLYPWVLGLSHGTTKNWVDSQHDLLMQRVARGCSSGIRFLEWIQNSELAMAGSPVRVRQTFEPLRDPGKLLQERAQRFKWTRVKEMQEAGYYTRDEAAREMGLTRWPGGGGQE